MVYLQLLKKRLELVKYAIFTLSGSEHQTEEDECRTPLIPDCIYLTFLIKTYALQISLFSHSNRSWTHMNSIKHRPENSSVSNQLSIYVYRPQNHKELKETRIVRPDAVNGKLSNRRNFTSLPKVSPAYTNTFSAATATIPFTSHTLHYQESSVFSMSFTDFMRLHVWLHKKRVF